MFDAEFDSILTRRVRTMRFIVAALACGVLVLLAVVLFAPLDGFIVRPGGAAPVVTYLALGYGGLTLLAGWLAPPILIKAVRRKMVAGLSALPPQRAGREALTGPLLKMELDVLVRVLFGQTILAGAIFEGGAIFLAAAYLVDRQPACAIGAAVLAGAILLHFPTRDRAATWIENQLREINTARDAAPSSPSSRA